MAQPVLPASSPTWEPSKKKDRFTYLTLNMRYTLRVWNANPPQRWAQIALRIAEIALIPLLMIGACEALFKNGAFLLANLAIGAANNVYRFLTTGHKVRR